MNTNDVLQIQMTVEDVLKKWPETRVVLKSQGTFCIGCFMQRFCTLQDVAETYQIPAQDLMTALENVSNKHTSKEHTHENKTF